MRGIFSIALVATVFAVASFIVWQFYAYLGGILPISVASHVADLANESLAIGIVVLVIAVALWALALRDGQDW